MVARFPLTSSAASGRFLEMNRLLKQVFSTMDSSVASFANNFNVLTTDAEMTHNTNANEGFDQLHTVYTNLVNSILSNVKVTFGRFDDADVSGRISDTYISGNYFIDSWIKKVRTDELSGNIVKDNFEEYTFSQIKSKLETSPVYLVGTDTFSGSTLTLNAAIEKYIRQQRFSTNLTSTDYWTQFGDLSQQGANRYENIYNNAELRNQYNTGSFQNKLTTNEDLQKRKILRTLNWLMLPSRYLDEDSNLRSNVLPLGATSYNLNNLQDILVNASRDGMMLGWSNKSQHYHNGTTVVTTPALATPNLNPGNIFNNRYRRVRHFSSNLQFNRACCNYTNGFSFTLRGF